MNAPAFKLDANEAKQGSGGGGKINDLGKFIGKIKFAKVYQTENKAWMVIINFEADAGAYANLKICTHGRDGQPIFGSKQLQSIMACTKNRDLTPVEQTVDDYDVDAGCVKPCQRTVYKELTGARIGFALYREDSTYQDNDKSEMKIAASFNAETEQTASEVLDKATPEKLEMIVSNLKNKDLRQQSGGAQYQGHSQHVAAQGVSDDFDDDIPF